jgi:glycosyltransferase involved in cell wall biosynthesis
MKVLLTNEYRFYRDSEGRVWTPGQFSYSYFTRYLDVFDHVAVAARIKLMPAVSDAWQRADGPEVSFTPLPFYVGPIQFALRAYSALQVIRRAVPMADAAILRAPGILSDLAEWEMRRAGRPYALEVVTDPLNIFARGVVDHPFRPFFRAYSAHQLRCQCQQACAIAYLTKEALQQRYPPGPDVFHTSYPEVELTNDAFAASGHDPRDYCAKPLTLVTVGSLAQLYKGVDVLLRALKQCLLAGLDLELMVIGDGRYRPQLEALTAELNMDRRVHFLGQLPSGRTVRGRLDAAQVFILPSRTEGMPSAMIEAMARGLPCIGSAVGGIPELLEPDELVSPSHVQALARKIGEIVTNPDRMASMSARNLQKAWGYHNDVLRVRRIEFYHRVKEQSRVWSRVASAESDRRRSAVLEPNDGARRRC